MGLPDQDSQAALAPWLDSNLVFQHRLATGQDDPSKFYQELIQRYTQAKDKQEDLNKAEIKRV